MRKTPLVVCVLLCATSAGCSKISLGKLREKNKAAIDAATSAFAEMSRVVESSPPPTPGGSCSRPGLAPAPKFSLGYVEGDAGGGGDITETIDAAAMVKSEKIPPPNGLFESEGPLKTVVWDAWYAKTELSFEVDEKKAQVRYDEAKKVRYALVARVKRSNDSAPADRAEVYLFELPTPKLVCSFAIDVSADRELAKKNGYDPNTGDPAEETSGGEVASDIGALFAAEVSERFGLAVTSRQAYGKPALVAKKRLPDDPRVLERAKKVSTALDGAPEKLTECKGDEAKGALRMNKKALRILARGELLARFDPNVQIDAKSSTNVTSYLRARDKQSADAVASAASWKVLDFKYGGTAASIDGKSFVGGGATGRLVVFDKADAPLCQKTVRIAPPSTLDAKVTRYRTGGVATNIGEQSKVYLHARLDETLGLP